MLRPFADRRDNAQRDLGDVGAVARSFHGGDGAGDDGGMPAVKLRTSEQAFNMAHKKGADTEVPAP